MPEGLRKCPKCGNTRFNCRVEVEIECDVFEKDIEEIETLSFDFEKDVVLTCSGCGEECLIEELGWENP